MKKYWIDFSGYLCVEAENENEAERYGDTFKAPTAQEIEDFWNEK